MSWDDCICSERYAQRRVARPAMVYTGMAGTTYTLWIIGMGPVRAANSWLNRMKLTVICRLNCQLKLFFSWFNISQEPFSSVLTLFDSVNSCIEQSKNWTERRGNPTCHLAARQKIQKEFQLINQSTPHNFHESWFLFHDLCFGICVK